MNKGFALARGRIFTFLNADDTYLPGAVSAAVRNLVAHPSMGVVYGEANYVQSAQGAYQAFFDSNIQADFVGIGKMRGVGWAICYQNPVNQRLSNHWITLHETGNIAGFSPILVMDVWEHAYLLDYKPADRPKYIEAFFSNIDWQAVEKRLGQAIGAKAGA